MINMAKRFKWGAVHLYIVACGTLLVLASACVAEQVNQKQDCTPKSARKLLGNSSFENHVHFELGDDAESGLVSAIDNFGWGEVLPKVVLSDGRLVISRQEIDYMVQLTCSNVQWSMSELSTSSDGPDSTRQLDSAKFTPPIASFYLYNDRVERASLSALEDAEPFGPMISGQPNKPLSFYLPKGRPSPLAIIFLSSSVLSKLSVAKMSISKERVTEEDEESSPLVETIIKLDIDGDNSPDILYHTEQGGVFDDEEGEHFASRIYMLHKGKWYLSGQAWMGQLGEEGF